MSVCSFVSSQSATSSQTPTSSSSPPQPNTNQTLCSSLNEKPILTLVPKTSPKQVLMLNSNRLNLTSTPHSTLNTTDSSVQYVVKKSPTILILSKPKTELKHVNKPAKSSSNLISSYFNKQNNNSSGQNTTSLTPNAATTTQYNLPIQLVPNSKPITLIPIGKLAPNSSTSNFSDNFNGLIPIETIEISTATIEINSTDEPNSNVQQQQQQQQVEPVVIEPVVKEIVEEKIEEKVEVKIEPKIEIKNEPEEESEPIVKEIIPKIDKPKQETILNKSDVTRCICEMDHDDGFMICCDNCLVWQHIACMEVNKKKIPDKFYCEKCDPRAVNAPKARQIQEKYLKNLAKNLNKIKNRRNSSSSNTTQVAQTPPCHLENEQIELKNEPLDEPTLDDTNLLSPSGSSDQTDGRSNRHKRQYKSRTIREEFEHKQTDETNLNEYSNKLIEKFQYLDLKLNQNQNVQELLKVIKVKNKKQDEQDDQKLRVKLLQNVNKDQIIIEHIGHVSLADENQNLDPMGYTLTVKISTNIEHKPSTSSSSSSSTTNLNEFEDVIVSIDSSKIYNNSRYIRKSCVHNSCIVPSKDNKGNLKFYVQATENVSKNSEIYLPPDPNSVANSVCLCESPECELKLRLSGKAPKTTPVKSIKKETKIERRPSTQSPGPVQIPEDTHVNLKNLSREDRKLASYMRVIEKLEKQGKRKKEVKVREKSLESESQCEKKIETFEKENEKTEKSSKKSKSSRPSLLIQKQQQQLSEQIDQEIATINESVKPIENDDLKPTVKSPDYSFVNLSIQPRRTLNLLQRNLDSEDENRFSPALESLENNKNFLTNKSFFHPKKHWLKSCCSNEDSQIDHETLSPSKNETSQPPKKRRIFIEDTEQISTTQPNEQLNINVKPVQQVYILPEHQFYLNFINFMPQMSSPNFPMSLNSAPLSAASTCSTPSFYTPNQFYVPDPFAFHQMAAMYHQNLIPPVQPVTSLPSPQSNTSLNESLGEPAKKKVSLAEYRQRKETVKQSEVLFESISSSKSFTNDDSLCELDVYPTNTESKTDNKSEEVRHSSTSSCSSRCSRKSSLSNISVISSCSSIRSRSPSCSSQRSHSSRLSSFERQDSKPEEKKSQDEPKYFKFKYKQEDNLKRKLLDDMLDEYRNEGLKLKRKPRTRSCSLNRSPSESRSDSSLDDNWHKRSDNYYAYKKRSNSLNRRKRMYECVRPSRSNEDNYQFRHKYNKQKFPKNFDLRYQLNKSHFSKSYGSSSSSSSSSISSSNEISSSLSCVVKKF